MQAFRDRQQEQKLVKVPTAKQIVAGRRARQDPDRRPRPRPIGGRGASGRRALQAFEDGLYLVVLDEEQQDNLDREIHVATDSKITFVRLTMLAGARG